MEREVSGVKIILRTGDIAAQQEIAAIVNAANAALETGGGVAGAIHKAAGPELAAEGRKLAPIKPGEAVITSAYNLPNEYVIHCLGPVYGKDEPGAELLAQCYQNALALAKNHEIGSIAFPAISMGAFGYPKKEAAHIALTTVLDNIKKQNHLKKVVFVLYSKEDLQVFETVFKEITSA